MSSLNNRWKSLLLSPASLWMALFLTGTTTGLIAPSAKASQNPINASQPTVGTGNTVVLQQPIDLVSAPAIPSVDVPMLPSRLAASAVTTSRASDPLANVADIQPLDATDESDEASDMDQVTSVSQLADVKPTDWAFQALQSLVERYGCIVGYPDKTYRGNRALTRYEFAAGLNACMDRINELIAAGTADLVKKEDLLAVQRLQEQFATELATLRGRVGAL